MHRTVGEANLHMKIAFSLLSHHDAQSLIMRNDPGVSRGRPLMLRHHPAHQLVSPQHDLGSRLKTVPYCTVVACKAECEQIVSAAVLIATGLRHCNTDTGVPMEIFRQ